MTQNNHKSWIKTKLLQKNKQWKNKNIIKKDELYKLINKHIPSYTLL